MIKILLIDDHALFRSGLRMLLSSGLANMEVHELASIEDAMKCAERLPSVVLLDIQLRGLNGLDGLALLSRKWPETPVVVLSSDDTEKTVNEAIKRGAVGFVSKNDSAEHILAFIRAILGGAHPSDPALASTRDCTPDHKPHLTPRQLEVLDFLCQGLSNKAIGRRMELSENTVRGHVQAIFAALQVESRSQAVAAAHRRALVH
jgi:DNA-binding NarL/FixJ family response regulator